MIPALTHRIAAKKEARFNRKTNENGNREKGNGKREREGENFGLLVGWMQQEYQ